METTALKNDDATILRTISDKSRKNKISVIATSIISLITEILFYIIFGSLLAIEMLPFESLIWKEILKGGTEIPPHVSDTLTHIIIIVKLILAIIGITFLSFGLLL